MCRESTRDLLLALLRSQPRSYFDLAQAGFTPDLLDQAVEDLAAAGVPVRGGPTGLRLVNEDGEATRPASAA